MTNTTISIFRGLLSLNTIFMILKFSVVQLPFFIVFFFCMELNNKCNGVSWEAKSLRQSRNCSPIIKPENSLLCLPLDPILSQTNVKAYSFKIHFNIILQSVTRSHNLFLPFMLLDQNFGCIFHFCCVHYMPQPCHPYNSLCKCTLWRFSLCSFLLKMGAWNSSQKSWPLQPVSVFMAPKEKRNKQEESDLPGKRG
jgi:hypothetical protein